MSTNNKRTADIAFDGDKLTASSLSKVKLTAQRHAPRGLNARDTAQLRLEQGPTHYANFNTFRYDFAVTDQTVRLEVHNETGQDDRTAQVCCLSKITL